MHIVGFMTTNGYVQPVAWSDRIVSKSEAKRIVSKFRNDSDYVKHVVMPVERLYHDSSAAKRELERI